METKLVRIDENHIDAALIDAAGEVIRTGGLVAFPTETVYGLGGDALNAQSSEKIYRAKGRPSDNPLIVHIADMDALGTVAREVPESARKLAGRFWPGPLTMILPKADIVPRETTGGLDTVAVRMPVHPVARERLCGRAQREPFGKTKPYAGEVCHRGSGRQDRYDPGQR